MLYWIISISIVSIVLYFFVQFIKEIRPQKRRLVNTEVELKNGKLREIGLLESWYSASHDSRVFITFNNVVELFGIPPTLDEMITALLILMEKNLELSVTIVDDHYKSFSGAHFALVDIKNKEFKGLPIEIIELDENSDENSWKSYAKEEHFKTFDVKDPNSLLWRIRLVKKSGKQNENSPFQLIFTYHHIIFDGIAGINFIKQFIELLGDPTLLQNKNKVDGIPKSTKLHPPLDNLLDIRPTIGHIVEELFFDSFPNLHPKKKVYLGQSDLAVPRSDRDFLVTYSVLDEKTTSEILTSSKLKKTTFHGILSSASHFAFVRALEKVEDNERRANDHNNKNGIVLFSSIASAVNLRPFLSVDTPNKQLGTFVCGPMSFHKIKETTEFFALSREIKSELVANLKSAYRKIGILQFLSGSWKDFFRRKCERIPNAREETIHISNLGKIDIDFPKKWRMKAVWFINSKPAEGPVVTIACVTVNGRCFMSTTVPSPSCSKKFIDEYDHLLVKCMNKSTSHSDFLLKDFN